MHPRNSFKPRHRIPVARHLSDAEYLRFLDAYAQFCGSQPEPGRLNYCADHICSVERRQDGIVVSFIDGAQFTLEIVGTETSEDQDTGPA